MVEVLILFLYFICMCISLLFHEIFDDVRIFNYKNYPYLYMHYDLIYYSYLLLMNFFYSFFLDIL